MKPSIFKDFEVILKKWGINDSDKYKGTPGSLIVLTYWRSQQAAITCVKNNGPKWEPYGTPESWISFDKKIQFVQLDAVLLDNFLSNLEEAYWYHFDNNSIHDNNRRILIA